MRIYTHIHAFYALCVLSEGRKGTNNHFLLFYCIFFFFAVHFIVTYTNIIITINSILLLTCPLSRIWLYLFAVYDYYPFSSLLPFCWALLVLFIAIQEWGDSGTRLHNTNEKGNNENWRTFSLYFLNGTNLWTILVRFVIYFRCSCSYSIFSFQSRMAVGSQLFHNQHAQKGNETYIS